MLVFGASISCAMWKIQCAFYVNSEYRLHSSLYVYFMYLNYVIVYLYETILIGIAMSSSKMLVKYSPRAATNVCSEVSPMHLICNCSCQCLFFRRFSFSRFLLFKAQLILSFEQQQQYAF